MFLLLLLFCRADFLISFYLQILSSVLEMIPSAFSIKLAALASRKELLDLEKWLSNNLNTYRDIFFEVIFRWPSPRCYMQISNNISVSSF